MDRVRYEATAPWPAPAPGASLQLRDAAQDNSRVANWAVGDTTVIPPQSLPLLAYTNAWKFMQVSNLDGVSGVRPPTMMPPGRRGRGCSPMKTTWRSPADSHHAPGSHRADQQRRQPATPTISAPEWWSPTT